MGDGGALALSMQTSKLFQLRRADPEAAIFSLPASPVVSLASPLALFLTPFIFLPVRRPLCSFWSARGSQIAGFCRRRNAGDLARRIFQIFPFPTRLNFVRGGFSPRSRCCIGCCIRDTSPATQSSTIFASDARQRLRNATWCCKIPHSKWHSTGYPFGQRDPIFFSRGEIDSPFLFPRFFLFSLLLILFPHPFIRNPDCPRSRYRRLGQRCNFICAASRDATRKTDRCHPRSSETSDRSIQTNETRSEMQR